MVLCLPRATHNVSKKPTPVGFNTIVKNNCTINVLDCKRVEQLMALETLPCVIGSQKRFFLCEILILGSIVITLYELRCDCTEISMEAFLTCVALFVCSSQVGYTYPFLFLTVINYNSSSNNIYFAVYEKIRPTHITK